MEENYQDLFNLNPDDFENSSSGSSSADERYRPNAKDGKDNVYRAVIRFLPWHANPKKSIMQKWTAWLVDPVTGEGRYVDCPSTVGKKSILQDTFWKLKKSESVAEQELAKNFSRRQQFASLVQIIKDDHNPENVGKIMVFTYGIKIYNKIMQQIKPAFGKPHIPFDLFEGRPFHLHVCLVAGYNNYDQSEFLTEKLPFTINGEILEKTPENLKRITEYLKENSPDLSKYDYREWDEETHEFVLNVIKNTIPKGRIIEQIQKANPQAFAKVSNTKKQDIDLGEVRTVKTEMEEIKHKPVSNIPSVESVVEKIENTPPKEEFNLDDIDFDDEYFDEDELYNSL